MSTARTPQELHQALAAAYNRKDVDGLLALFEPDASLVPRPGQLARGTDEIRRALADFVELGGSMRVEKVHVVEAGAAALSRTVWSISHGGRTSVQANGSEVVRRQADGSWRFVVDHPFGAETPAERA